MKARRVTAPAGTAATTPQFPAAVGAGPERRCA